MTYGIKNTEEVAILHKDFFVSVLQNYHLPPQNYDSGLAVKLPPISILSHPWLMILLFPIRILLPILLTFENDDRGLAVKILFR
jgi:hypothetical protein